MASCSFLLALGFLTGSFPGAAAHRNEDAHEAKAEVCDHGRTDSTESLVEVREHTGPGIKPFDFVGAFGGVAGSATWPKLGRGSQGSVYKTKVTAHTSQLEEGDSIAVKRTSKDRGDCKLAKNEWGVASRILHPNVLKVYDFNSSDALACWMAMELLESPQPLIPGTNAVSYLKDTEAAEGLRIWREIVGGYKAVCKAGFVQKDKNPENLVVTCPSGSCSVRIFDFGFAKSLESQECGILPSRPKKCSCRIDVVNMIKKVSTQSYNSGQCGSGKCLWKEKEEYKNFGKALDDVLKSSREAEWEDHKKALEFYDCLLKNLQGNGEGKC